MDSGDDKLIDDGIDEADKIRLTENFNSIFGDDELVFVYDIMTNGGNFHVMEVG